MRDSFHFWYTRRDMARRKFPVGCAGDKPVKQRGIADVMFFGCPRILHRHCYFFDVNQPEEMQKPLECPDSITIDILA